MSMASPKIFLRDSNYIVDMDTDTRHVLKILHHCGKKVKTKNQKVFEANFPHRD